MKQRDSRMLVVKCIVLIVSTAFLWGYDMQPPPTGMTGGFGGPTCVTCHTSYGLNSGGGTLTIQGVPAQYTPGTTYPITIQFSHPNRNLASKWGFETAVRFQNNQSQAGQIIVTDLAKTFARTDNGIQYLSHVPNSPLSVWRGNPGPVNWTFNWQAPAQAGGPVIFNVAGNAANGDGTPFGDFIYTASQTSNPGITQFPNNTYFAQFANGGGVISSVTLTNPGNNPVTAGLTMTADDGSPMNLNLISDPPVADITNFTIAPMGFQTFTTDGQGGLVAGWLKVGYNGTLSGVILFNVSGTSTGVGESIPMTGGLTPVTRNATTGLDTGVAIINTTASAVVVTLTLHRADGSAVGPSTTLNLPPNGHTARYIDQLFPTIDTRNFKGTLEVRGGGSMLAVLAVRIGGGEFTTLPVAPLP